MQALVDGIKTTDTHQVTTKLQSIESGLPRHKLLQRVTDETLGIVEGLDLLRPGQPAGEIGSMSLDQGKQRLCLSALQAYQL